MCECECACVSVPRRVEMSDAWMPLHKRTAVHTCSQDVHMARGMMNGIMHGVCSARCQCEGGVGVMLGERVKLGVRAHRVC